MKRIASVGGFILIIMAMAMMGGCVIFLGEDGADGTSYLQVQYGEDGMIASIEGFPSGWSAFVDYPVAAGTHNGAYVLFDVFFDGNYDVLFNDNIGNFYDEWPSVADVITDYLAFEYADHANPFAVDITVNPGEPGTLFTDGDAGADKFYTLWLDWNPLNSYQDPYPSASGPKALVIEQTADRVVRELTQGKFTMRFTATKGGAVPADLPAPQVFLPKAASK